MNLLLTSWLQYDAKTTEQMSRESRTMLGPNLYVSPGKIERLLSHHLLKRVPSLLIIFYVTIFAGGGFTDVHRDGDGTVDSGHMNLHGYNEVIILRRLPEIHQLNAGTKMGIETLSVLPHDRKRSLKWPTNSIIKWLKSMKYVDLLL